MRHSGVFKAAGKLIFKNLCSPFWSNLGVDGVSEEHVAQSGRRRRKRRRCCGQVFMFRGGGEDLLQERGGRAAAQTGVSAPLVR